MTESRQAKERLRWRCRRGMLELDLLLQGFLDRGYARLNPGGQQVFENLLDYPDDVLLELLMGRSAAADPEVADVIEEIRITDSH